ncbi:MULTISPECIES: TetR/AcrR family transcriptional regulator [unclassified Streptomyces]|uniref:TetR/AcrR family transcriptional regulator n=1 Tax=unclassified Streptomyces TaxID=2593676 RepID=UPI001CBB1A19|nr:MULTISPECIES: TetR/AcrR family transcriptional regulator [unclassified Streptomyces]WPO69191.1 TetR/AcrR family transcriptional regulator [Streptomyces sp. KN37]
MAVDEDRVAARKTQIFEAAAAVFARQGYHNARMDDVVKAAGVSKGGLYWYFKSKEELATGLVHQMLTHEADAMQAAMAGETPAADRLQHLVRAFAGDLTKNPDRAPLALELLALGRTIPDIRACFDSHHEQFVEHIATLLAQMNGAGPDAPDTHTAALAFASMIDGMVLRWTLARSPFDLENTLWEATQVLLRGMAMPQPR